MFSQIHDIVFHGNGGYDWETVYHIPIWLRRFTFNKVKEFIDNLDIEEFDIKLNKRLNYTWNGYYDWKERCGFEGNFLDYKKECLESEKCIILKIRWKG